MSKELVNGIVIGFSSRKLLGDALRKISSDLEILAYLDDLPCSYELELVAAINYMLGRDLELTPSVKVCLAKSFAISGKRLLLSGDELAVKQLIDSREGDGNG